MPQWYTPPGHVAPQAPEATLQNVLQGLHGACRPLQPMLTQLSLFGRLYVLLSPLCKVLPSVSRRLTGLCILQGR